MVMENHGQPSKNHIPCQSWAGQNGWSTTSTQGSIFHPQPSSQHLSLHSSSGQRPSYELQASSQSCMMDINNVSSSHHSALYTAAHRSVDASPSALFANSPFPSSSQGIFVQQNRHSSPMMPGNQGKHIPPPSLPQTNQAPQPCGSQQLPHISNHNPYDALFQPPLSNQGLPNELQDLPVSLPSCDQQRAATSQATSGGGNVGFADLFGNTRSHSSSTQKPPQWIPQSHCRGTPKESDPDAAAHPKAEPGQGQGNTTPLVTNESRRSLLLHQRARLLQQLAELDKCLESAPPDDDSDGHTAAEFPPSKDDPSQCEQNRTSDTQQVEAPLLKSEDEENETCNTPGDPVSSKESVKKEIASDNSEADWDPEYCPGRDSDSSSAGSSHSRPTTPTDTRPSAAGKEEADENESANPPRQISAANLKISSVNVLPLPCPKARLSHNKRNYCLFCSKPVTKMARHLQRIHCDKTEVAAAFQYPKMSKERLRIWNRLINEGNFAHNKNVLKTGKGHLAVRHRSKYARQARDFIHCLYCRGLFVKNAMFRHLKFCPEKVKNGKEKQFGQRRIALRCVLEASDDLCISDGLRNVLSKMTFNDVTQTVINDEVILQFGEQMFDQYGNDEKKDQYISQNLRAIARLVLEAQKTTPLKKLEDFFLPSSFPYVVSAVNVLAGYNAESKKYRIPSLAIKLGYHLQKACSIVEGNAVRKGDASLAESAQKFLSVYQKKWNNLISGSALTTLKETKLKKAKKVPLVEDVKRLSFHLEKVHPLAEERLRESPSAENYAELVRLILARTIIFNRRQAREIELVQLKDFTVQKKSNLDAGMNITMSDLEKKMCQFFTRIDIQASCGRMVPIILKPSFVSAMDLFVKAREKCGVPSENPFLFGRPKSLNAYSASACMQKYVKECGAKEPGILSSIKMRKHYATTLQMINLDENEADQILGLNNQVRDLRQNSSMQLDDTDMDSDGSDNLATRVSKRTAAKSVQPGKKGTRGAKNKHKWEEAEVLAVEKHLMRFIEEHIVPQKNDCVECLMAEQEALSKRSWRGVKDYVRNRITSLKHAKKRGAKDRGALPSKKIRKQHTTALRSNNQVQTSQKTCSKQQDDEVLDSDGSDETIPPARGQPAESRNRNEPRDTNYGPREKRNSNTAGPSTSKNSGRKGSKSKGKHKWEEEEVRAVERHLIRFIEGHKIPQKNDCLQCLAAEPDALRTRSWKGVKDYVRNRITALMRQSRTPKYR